MSTSFQSDSDQPHIQYKICQIIGGDYCTGGLEKHFIELTQALSRTYEVHVIAHPSYASHLDASIHFHDMDLSKPRNHPLLLFNLSLTINKIQPEIVHTHAKKSGQMLAILRPFIKAKTIVTIHNQTVVKWWMLRYDRLICVSKTIQDALHGALTSVVYNGIKKPEPS